MTLVASARVPDGIVIATDSLASLQAATNAQVRTTIECPHCGKSHEANLHMPIPINLGVVSTMPNAQKLLPLFERFAVGLFGSSMIGTRTIFSLVREFEVSHSAASKKWSLESTAKSLAEWLREKLSTSLPEGESIEAIPDDASALGFQLIGYDGEQPTTTSVHVGNKIKTERFSDFGVTANGDTVVTRKLWELPGADARLGQAHMAWSLQDAIEYLRFLISTTSSLQRFATTIPTVGGETDVGVITLAGNFKWVARKPLARLLFDDNTEETNE